MNTHSNYPHKSFAFIFCICECNSKCTLTTITDSLLPCRCGNSFDSRMFHCLRHSNVHKLKQFTESIPFCIASLLFLSFQPLLSYGSQWFDCIFRHSISFTTNLTEINAIEYNSQNVLVSFIHFSKIKLNQWLLTAAHTAISNVTHLSPLPPHEQTEKKDHNAWNILHTFHTIPFFSHLCEPNVNLHLSKFQFVVL